MKNKLYVLCHLLEHIVLNLNLQKGKIYIQCSLVKNLKKKIHSMVLLETYCAEFKFTKGTNIQKRRNFNDKKDQRV